MGTRNRIPCAWVKQVGETPTGGAWVKQVGETPTGAEGQSSRQTLSRAAMQTTQPVPIGGASRPLQNAFEVDVWSFDLAIALKF